MTGRATILAAIGSQLAAVPGSVETRRQYVRSDIHALRNWPKPATTWALLDKFRERVLGLSCTIEELNDVAAIPKEVARYLAEYELPLSVNGWAEFEVLDWKSAGITFRSSPVTGESKVGLTHAFCAMSETGALMQLSGPATQAAASLLPETHIAVVRADRLVGTMEEAWAKLKSETIRQTNRIPRAVNFIAGPSRTGDIEQTTTIGVHGPRRVHIILLHDRGRPSSLRTDEGGTS